MTLFDELKSFSGIGFREIYKQFIYVHCRELLEEMMPGELDEAITGVIAYCYIDRTEGISFRPVLLAVMRDETLQVFNLPHFEDTIYVLRLREGNKKLHELHDNGTSMFLYPLDPKEYSFLDLSIVNYDPSSLKEFKDHIDECYFAGDAVENLRSEEYAYLDQYRHEWYPDDVMVALYLEKNGVEKVWARLTYKSTDGDFLGELLNEPYQDYGCHKGSLIEITEVKSETRSDLVFTGRTAKISEE